MRLAVFGLPLAGLLLAADGHEIVLAAVSPVAAPGRRRLRRTARAFFDTRELSPRALEAAVQSELATRAPELIVSWFWTRRIPERWLRDAPLGGLNAHPSLLPRHRGPDPFFWAIDSGDVVTGVTVHEMESTYDTGRVLAQESVAIGERNAWQLARALDRPSLRVLRRVVSDLARGVPVPRRAQEPAKATWAPVPSADSLRCDWFASTERVLRRIRALAPRPGLAVEIRGRKLFVIEARRTSNYPLVLHPGEAAVQAGPDCRVVIRSGDSAVAIERAVVECAPNRWETLDGRTLPGHLWTR